MRRKSSGEVVKLSPSEMSDYLALTYERPTIRRHRAKFYLGVSKTYDAEFESYCAERRAKAVTWELACKLLEAQGLLIREVY